MKEKKKREKKKRIVKIAVGVVTILAFWQTDGCLIPVFDSGWAVLFYGLPSISGSFCTVGMDGAFLFDGFLSKGLGHKPKGGGGKGKNGPQISLRGTALSFWLTKLKGYEFWRPT